MHTIMTGFALVAALALGGGHVLAADQLIPGKKLLIRNPRLAAANNKLVFLSTSPTLQRPSGTTEDPRCIPNGTVMAGSASAAITVTGTPSGEGFSIPLACHNWSASGANTFKYRDYGGATCKIVVIRDARLIKAVCKGPQIAYDLGIAESNVDVVFRTGPTNRYCSSFNSGSGGCQVVKDGSNDRTYLAKNCASGPAVCGASPGGAFLDVASLY